MVKQDLDEFSVYDVWHIKSLMKLEIYTKIKERTEPGLESVIMVLASWSRYILKNGQRKNKDG